MNVKVGDKIRIIDATPHGDFHYKNGDIFYVSNVWKNGEGIDVGNPDNGGTELYDREFDVVPDAFDTAEIQLRDISELNGKTIRIYSGAVVASDIKTEVTVGIDEATGVMYVLGMKTEVVE